MGMYIAEYLVRETSQELECKTRDFI